MEERPAYKDHPLWNEAMDLARQAYAVAEAVKARDPETSQRLRKAAIRVPAQIAGALSAEADVREEHVLAARSALAEVSRQAARAQEDPARTGDAESALAERALHLDRAVLFELAAAPGGTVC